MATDYQKMETDTNGQTVEDASEKVMPEDKGMSPLDEIIYDIENWIKTPESVKVSDFQELKSRLTDLKSYLDSGESSEIKQDRPDDGAEEVGHAPGLMVMIGQMKKKGMR